MPVITHFYNKFLDAYISNSNLTIDKSVAAYSKEEYA